MKGISIWLLKLLIDTYPNNAELGRVIRDIVKEGDYSYERARGNKDK
jgi:hypothetical protein